MIYECVMSSQSQTVLLPVLKTIEGAFREWNIWLKENPGESSSPVDLRDALHAFLVVKESSRSSVVFLTTELQIVNPAEGLLRLTLLPTDMSKPGLWWGAIQIFNPLGYLVDQVQCRVMVTRSATSVSDNAPLTVEEVRDFLMDRCPEDNRLLMAEQFTDDQIINAMVHPIEEWNDTAPCIGTFTTVTFPWNRPHLLGTASWLMQTAAINQIRNNATYQAGNTTVNDSDKGPVFLQIADKLGGEWKAWLVAKKRELNIRQGWGSSSIREF